MQTAPDLFSSRKFWAHRFGVAKQLPMSREEMDDLGWDSCDIILVTGDAYVDHPSFGMALIGRLLESQGFRVGIISQPDWLSADDFKQLGKPNLFFGVTGGNMDSMVNRYTSDRRIRTNDAYTADGEGGKRPDRCVVPYSQRCREAYKGVPIIIGGIEASLRRIAHFDYWSEKVRRSVIMDAKADILVYGNGERQIVEIAHRLARNEDVKEIIDIRGTAVILKHGQREGWWEKDSTSVDVPGKLNAPIDPYQMKTASSCDEDSGQAKQKKTANDGAQIIHFKRAEVQDKQHTVVRLPAYQTVKEDKISYAHTSRILHLETNPGNAFALVQQHGERDVWLNPPPIPLTTEEMDGVFDLPYTRVPHKQYGDKNIPAYEMIRFSVNIMRGCFGGCTFCSITEHEGRIIQSRSEDSIIKEVEAIRDTTPGFTGVISDLGGPTANMYRLACNDKKIEESCRRLSCVFPSICKNLGTDHTPLINLYKRTRALPGIKKVLIASGLRYDLAVLSPEYVKELVTHHVGGYLKIAPEHTEDGPLEHMMKPGIGTYDAFKAMFDKYSKLAGKEQYLIPYFIAAHPGTTDKDMMNLAIWLKSNGFRADQVQAYLPSPMSAAAAMYHSGKNTLSKVKRKGGDITVPKGIKVRRLHKAFLRYHDPENWPMLRDALQKMGRSDLIGNGKKHLIPTWQPAGTGGQGEGYRVRGKTSRPAENSSAQKGKRFQTQHVRPAAKSKPAKKRRR